MNQPLITKTSNFINATQKIIVEIQILRTKNNQFQRMSTQQFDNTMSEEVHNTRRILEKQIAMIRQALDTLQSKFRQPQQKNKLKEIKKQFEKQSERYKVIIDSLYERSVMQFGRSVVRDTRTDQRQKHDSSSIHSQQGMFKKKKNSSIALEEQLDFEIEHRLAKERSQQLKGLQKRIDTVNQIYVQTAEMVNEQGQKIDIIGQNVQQAHKNVIDANEELDDAAKNQKKHKRKCFCIIFIIALVAILAAGVYFMISYTSSQ